MDSLEKLIADSSVDIGAAKRSKDRGAIENIVAVAHAHLLEIKRIELDYLERVHAALRSDDVVLLAAAAYGLDKAMGRVNSEGAAHLKVLGRISKGKSAFPLLDQGGSLTRDRHRREIRAVLERKLAVLDGLRSNPADEAPDSDDVAVPRGLK